MTFAQPGTYTFLVTITDAAEFPVEPWAAATSRDAMSNLVPSKTNLYMTGLIKEADGRLGENPDLRIEVRTWQEDENEHVLSSTLTITTTST